MGTWEELAGGRTPETCKTLARFQRYEKRNPELFPLLEEIIRDELGRREVWSVYPAIDAVIRWQSNQPLYDPEKRFRIPNDFKPWYLRTILLKHPEWMGRLEMRSLFCCGGKALDDDSTQVAGFWD